MTSTASAHHRTCPPGARVGRGGRRISVGVAAVAVVALLSGCSLWSQGNEDAATGGTAPDIVSARSKELAALIATLGITHPLDGGIRGNQFDDPENDISIGTPTTVAAGATPTASSSTTEPREPEERIPFATRFSLDLGRHGVFRHDAGTLRDALFGVGGRLACGAKGNLDSIPYAVLCPWAGAPDGGVFWFYADTNMDLTERLLDPTDPSGSPERFFLFVAVSCPVFSTPPAPEGNIGVTVSGSGPTGEGLGTTRFQLQLSPPKADPDASSTTTAKPNTPVPPGCTAHETAARAVLVGRTLAIGVPAREIYAPALNWHFSTAGLVAGRPMSDTTESRHSYVDESGVKRETTPATVESTTTTAPRTTTTTDPNATSTETTINLMPDGTFAPEPSVTEPPPTTPAPTTTTTKPPVTTTTKPTTTTTTTQASTTTA